MLFLYRRRCLASSWLQSEETKKRRRVSVILQCIWVVGGGWSWLEILGAGAHHVSSERLESIESMLQFALAPVSSSTKSLPVAFDRCHGC